MTIIAHRVTIRHGSLVDVFPVHGTPRAKLLALLKASFPKATSIQIDHVCGPL
jgi:hypothetical protein